MTKIIELRAETLAGLFDPHDPFPIPSRDLSRSAEDFIVGWARELPHDEPLAVRLHLPKNEADSCDQANVAQAFANHFRSRASQMAGDMADLFRVGRVSLLIGLAVLAACIVISQILGPMVQGETLRRFFVEGVIILGWVANWRPMEIFLYDWWPIRRRKRLFERLAAAPFEITPAA